MQDLKIKARCCKNPKILVKISLLFNDLKTSILPLTNKLNIFATVRQSENAEKNSFSLHKLQCLLMLHGDIIPRGFKRPQLIKYKNILNLRNSATFNKVILEASRDSHACNCIL